MCKMHPDRPKELIKRPQEQTDKLLSNLSDTIILKDFISDTDKHTLVNIYKKYSAEAVAKTTGPTTVITRHFKDDPAFIDIFERIQKELGIQVSIWGGNFFDTPKPFAIHNDVDFRHDIMPAKCMVIPLVKTYKTDYVYVTDEDAKFYIFDQTCPHGAVKCFKGTKDMPSPYNIPLHEYSMLTNVHNDNRIPNVQVSFNKQWLEGLSVEKECDWIPGDVIVFDCIRLHCSSDFREKGIQSKLGLSLFTQYK